MVIRAKPKSSVQAVNFNNFIATTATTVTITTTTTTALINIVLKSNIADLAKQISIVIIKVQAT